jgi:hypothetical protein
MHSFCFWLWQIQFLTALCLGNVGSVDVDGWKNGRGQDAGSGSKLDLVERSIDVSNNAGPVFCLEVWNKLTRKGLLARAIMLVLEDCFCFCSASRSSSSSSQLASFRDPEKKSLSTLYLSILCLLYLYRALNWTGLLLDPAQSFGPNPTEQAPGPILPGSERICLNVYSSVWAFMLAASVLVPW